MFEPGQRVQVVEWSIGDIHPNKNFPMNTVILWREPQVNFDTATQGPTLQYGTKATIIGVLYGHRKDENSTINDWVLLLSDASELGWTYELDGLKVIDD